MNNRIINYLTKKERIKLFLYLYYSYPGWKYIRIISGPLLIFIGIFFLNSQVKFNIAYGGFALGYGIYYTLKPFLNILLSIKKLKNYEESIMLNDSTNELDIQSNEIKLTIPLDKILKIKKLKRGYKITIKIENRKNYFILSKKNIKDGDLDELIKKIDQCKSKLNCR